MHPLAELAEGHAAGSAAKAAKVDKPKKVYTWMCGYCNLPFETENYNQRYCKPSHKQRAYEQRKAERDAQIENSVVE